MSAADRPDWATIPNLVTLVRLALLLPVCLRLADGPDTLAVVLLLVWASTDWIDGMLARALDQTSRTGQIMDPIADRLGLVAIVLTLALADLLPWAALAVIVVVDAAMAVLATRAALGGRISVSWLGKIRTFVLMASVFLLVAVAAWAPSLVPAAQALVWVGAVLHVGSGVDYIVRARRAPAAAPAEAGPPSRR
ncbi:CDP-alcohol phosphatidyltransferase family protein [Brachybacterium paraconglomeratum]|uniref:CDP-alcohol phosphatidyltransferase family protein n=1 Tax=Brachybacterium paraconglomeratum TaxID=173362 RepID=UPI0022AF6428|nr:CDP-alcohol phosphatidyltransferase family protein [Brachybacterium paraconglomeratum]MCZ4326693.1 CDP-alcohol phosphatidyltransferase family protein [Brachybacterium paraconglomeratum]